VGSEREEGIYVAGGGEVHVRVVGRVFSFGPTERATIAGLVVLSWESYVYTLQNIND
jgi:hypothetical protein